MGGSTIRSRGLAQAVQGVICFESIMEEGRKRGDVEGDKPIICKPNRTVSGATCTTTSCPALFRQTSQGC